jgi:hypothetical protein
VSVESKVVEASRLLGEAYDESPCKWCARHLKKLSEITGDLAEVVPYTEETARRVEQMRGADIREQGNKIGVLKRVVLETQGNTYNTHSGGENINTTPVDVHRRGIPMAGMDKKTAMTVVGSQVLLGTGLGFALNRVDEYWTSKRTSAGKATAFYQKIGPYVNIFGGIGLVVLGATGKIFKSDAMQAVGVVGGGAMIANGLLNLAEGAYKTYASGTAGRPGQKAYLPVMSRNASAMSPTRVEISSF